MAVELRQLERIFHMLKLLSADLEWVAMDMPDARKKALMRYKEKIDWIYRDFITSGSPESRRAITRELESERAKELTEWISIGIQAENLAELFSVLQANILNDKIA